MNNKLLVICGPTGVGKTKLALKIAKKFNAELISADSRQVYKNMDIGTGKDLPEGAEYALTKIKSGKQFVGFYEIDGVSVWGYDLVDPKDNFSVGEYIPVVKRIIKEIYKRDKIPLIVGGTGLYIKALIDGLDTIGIGPDPELRAGLSTKGVEELQELLRGLDPIKFASLNISDKNNPLRLSRAIEIAQSPKKKKIQKNNFDVLMIGLKLPKEQLEEKIAQRVKRRIDKGQLNEIKKLIDSGVSWGMQSMSSLGYSIWKDFFENQKTVEEVAQEWIKTEKQYAGKQMVWFKKDNKINWFEANESNLDKKIESLIKKWHNK